MIFKTIQGQARALKKIEQYINASRIPPAFLFVGPDGVGKKSAAIELAKYLNCVTELTDNRPCGECSPCAAAANNSHPFITVVDAEWQKALLGKEISEISIDTVRDIQRMLALKPPGGQKRVIIIDDAKKLSKEAANSFLKTLEEPPAETIIILIAISRRNILPTIISRCQIVEFGVVEQNIILQKLKEAAPEENEVLLKTYASAARGSVSRALRFLSDRSGLEEEKALFYSAEFAALKDADLPVLLSFIEADFSDEFMSDPAGYIEFREAVIKAKKQNFAGVNKNMILTELHSALLKYTEKKCL